MGVKNRLLIVIVTVLLVAVFLVISPKDYRARLRTTGDDSATSRTNELKRSIYLAVRHPIFGVGMGNYVVYSDTEHATHNAYTQVASELGLTAGVVYVLFLVAAFKRIRGVPHPKTVKDKNKTIYYLAIGLRACLVGYMVTSFFASVAYLWYVYYLVGYIICISRLCEESARREDTLEHEQQAPSLA
jgi:O-antigen ligase